MTMRVLIIGRGRVGTALARALRRAGISVSTLSGRGAAPAQVRADLVVVAVRDAELARWATLLAPLVGPRRGAVVHSAGAFGPEALDAVRAAGGATGQLHIALSFADRRHPPLLSGARALIQGEPIAVRLAKRLARAIGLVPVCPRRSGGVDAVLYHAAAALLSNGAIALAHTACELLIRAGIAAHEAAPLLSPLLASTAKNLGALGLPGALTGPVRRGDFDTVAKHLARMAEGDAGHAALYRALLTAQLPLARALSEASTASLDRIATLAKHTAHAELAKHTAHAELAKHTAHAEHATRPKHATHRMPSKKGKLPVRRAG
ncbi:MAG: DUF2520 domain-containing protein [Myxococcales bacterium]|nr:DUF2520 domain-containing protein [Myxococcales bacterium]